MSGIGEGGHEQACRHLRQRTLRISILNLMDEDDPIDEISRIEARLERPEVDERANEQTREHQENDAERHFRHDQ